ncbi:hypothetical protein NEFER03_0007 [Nematocida sp. LUAm3]|nr:hypothetical protein NEFER03_0007 [Nematocida sp. LUAm3]KAI5173489.1 hypothetical protein NEFER02_0005 [Nematocida sp. LUAm2]KAI5176682.1 hypothetical protein NEFER01_0007 [Nematocida sp. LUAm1]
MLNTFSYLLLRSTQPSKIKVLHKHNVKYLSVHNEHVILHEGTAHCTCQHHKVCQHIISAVFHEEPLEEAIHTIQRTVTPPDTHRST